MRVTAQQVYEVHSGSKYTLTDEQRSAVEEASRNSPALVVAGAGSGKTELMAVRVLWLVANGYALPEQVLGLTYTRKAASELGDRIYRSLLKLRESHLWPEGLSKDFTQPTVMTYNAYSNGIFRENALGLGMEADSTLLTDAAGYQLAREVVIKYGNSIDARVADLDIQLDAIVERVIKLAQAMNDNLTDSTAIAHFFAEEMAPIYGLPRRKTGNEFTPTVEYANQLSNFAQTEILASLADEYRAQKRKLGYLDYSDQVVLAERAVREIPQVAEVQRQRFTQVLLDEYQDTSFLQTRLLSGLFKDMGVLAVGDPYQSIYGWRGASAANLSTFATDFAGEKAAEVRQFSLSTSWRNPENVLTLANRIAADLAIQPSYLAHLSPLKPVELKPRKNSGAGRVQVQMHQTLVEEAAAIASWIKAEAELFANEPENMAKSDTASIAVLVRTRKHMEIIRDALENQGLNVRIDGLGGLLEVPEIVDLVSALKVIQNPASGTELIRLLTGARWRIGAKDIDRLFRFARRVNQFHETDDSFSPEDALSIVDALDLLLDPKEAAQSRIPEPALSRMRNAAETFSALRRQTGLPLVDFVRNVERELWLDVEVMANPSRRSPMAYLNSFANTVANYAASNQRPHLASFLNWLDYVKARDLPEPVTAREEKGVVQLMTIHGAKGLEWDIVAVPHLMEGTFPDIEGTGWLSSGQLPYPLRGDRDSLPNLKVAGLEIQADFTTRAIGAFKDEEKVNQEREERRLMYVAVTRPKRSLLITSSYWLPGNSRAKVPSRYLLQATELTDDVVELVGRRDPAERAAALGIAVSQDLALPQKVDDENPLNLNQLTETWPLDPLGDKHRARLEVSSAAVRAALRGQLVGAEDEIDLLLKEREERSKAASEVPLPVRINASQFKDYLTDTTGLAGRMLRPVPEEPFKATRAGTVFHALMEERFGNLSQLLSEQSDLDLEEASERLWARQLESADLAEHEATIDTLRENFASSRWANIPAAFAEIEIQLAIDGNIFICKLDAVFQDERGIYEIVDWKTGAAPNTPEDIEKRGLQLALYRIAFATLKGLPLESVKACFYYVGENKVIEPTKLLTLPQLREQWSKLIETED